MCHHWVYCAIRNGAFSNDCDIEMETICLFFYMRTKTLTSIVFTIF